MPHDTGIGNKIYELNFKGSQFQMAGDFEAARVHYMGALLLEPNNAVVLGNLAGALYKLHRHEAGTAAGYRAVRINPFDHLSRNNLAINLVALGRLDEAKKQINEGLKLRPNNPPLYHTRGSVFFRQNDFKRAETDFARSRELGYDAYPTKNDLAIAVMAQGRLVEALPLYEIRWDELYKNTIWDLGIPEWQGEDLTGKSIIANSEQGFGDTIQFCRFIPKLIEQAARVGITTSPVLKRLLQEKFPNLLIGNCDEPEPEFKTFDYHTPMLSMVRHLGIMPQSIDPSPYLSVQEPLLRPFPGRFKIGLCWGSGDHGEALALRRRVLSLESFFPLATNPLVQLISLQKDENSKQIYDLGAEALIIDPMARVMDFYDTARIIHQLDLVISVDSAVAHLAGAIGKPTIVLGPRPRCWRWWNSPTGLPWYNNMTIYAQGENLSWDPAIRRTIRDVETLVQNLSKGS